MAHSRWVQVLAFSESVEIVYVLFLLLSLQIGERILRGFAFQKKKKIGEVDSAKWDAGHWKNFFFFLK